MARPPRLVSLALLPAALLCLGLWPNVTDAREQFLADPDADVEAAADAAAPPAAPAAAARERQRRQANDADWFRAPMQDARAAEASGPADFPSAEVHDAVVANARAAAARMSFRRAESALAASVRQAQQAFATSAELREAQAAEQRAYEDYQAARSEALRDVVADPKYQAMQDLRQNLSRQIADRRESADDAYERNATRIRLVSGSAAVDPSAVDPGPSESLVAIAALKMRVGSDARAMEREVLANNARVRDAQKALSTAGAKVAALRASAEQKIRNDEGLKKAREAVEDARIARVTAETYFRGADLAAGSALDFAYSLHRYDYNRYSRYYDPGLYDGYGYSYRLSPNYGFAFRRYRAIP